MEFWSLHSKSAPAGGSPESGALPFGEVWEFQKSLVEKRARDEIPDVFLFLEHRDVVTRGRGLQWTGQARERATPLPLLPPGSEYFEIERGGDLTWHGPGQLVVYPIVKLDGSGFADSRDITGFLRRLERATIALLARYGLTAEMRENATGVWVPGATPAQDRKLASIGIAVRKWVSYHGIALNVVNDLRPFSFFSPCGFESQVMGRLADLAPGFAGDASSGLTWRQRLERDWAEELNRAAARPGVGSVSIVNRDLESFRFRA